MVKYLIANLVKRIWNFIELSIHIFKLICVFIRLPNTFNSQNINYLSDIQTETPFSNNAALYNENMSLKCPGTKVSKKRVHKSGGSTNVHLYLEVRTSI